MAGWAAAGSTAALACPEPPGTRPGTRTSRTGRWGALRSAPRTRCAGPGRRSRRAGRPAAPACGWRPGWPRRSGSARPAASACPGAARAGRSGTGPAADPRPGASGRECAATSCSRGSRWCRRERARSGPRTPAPGSRAPGPGTGCAPPDPGSRRRRTGSGAGSTGAGSVRRNRRSARRSGPRARSAPGRARSSPPTGPGSGTAPSPGRAPAPAARSGVAAPGPRGPACPRSLRWTGSPPGPSGCSDSGSASGSLRSRRVGSGCRPSAMRLLRTRRAGHERHERASTSHHPRGSIGRLCRGRRTGRTRRSPVYRKRAEPR